MRVTFGPSKADQVVYIDARFLEAFSVEGVPRSRRFPADPTAQAKIVFGLQAQRPGLRSTSPASAMMRGALDFYLSQGEPMDAVVRGVAIYFTLLIIRFSGRAWCGGGDGSGRARSCHSRKYLQPKQPSSIVAPNSAHWSS
ncbi:hypothetical protein [Rhizobium brockwellii]